MSYCHAFRRIMAVLPCLLLSNMVFSQQRSNEESDEAGTRYRKQLQAFAESFSVFSDVQRTSRTTLLSKPIFSWANPQRRANGGALYLWIHDGRPHVTLGVWSFTDGTNRVGYELQSLAQQPFAAVSEKTQNWTPNAPGVTFERIKNVPAPTDTRIRRLHQMRQLATKHFSARVWEPGTKNAEQLRLLRNPIYRYEELPDGVIDGAMFSFAQGTDPDVLLILEARKIDKRPQWFFAMAPSTSRRVEGKFGDKIATTNDPSAADPGQNTFFFRQGVRL